MITFLALSLLLARQDPIQDLGVVGARDVLGTLEDGTGKYWMHAEKMDKPQLCPQRFGTPPAPWEFYYHTDAYVNKNLDPKSKELAPIRFRVYSQTPARNSGMGKQAAFELLVLWRMLHDHLHLDHKMLYHDGVVDVYLCEGGEPGGEQAFEAVPNSNPPVESNSIYIYDVAHFDDKMEQAREIAHEYGHAVIPPVGGFDGKNGAEYWANGNLGEKLFLRWGFEGIKANNLKEVCFMNTPAVAIDWWIKQHVDPLVKAAAVRPPDSPLLRGTNRAAYDAYQGIVLWCDSIMPSAMFGRSMTLIGSERAQDYVASAVQAAEERDYMPRIPGYVGTGPVWIPVGKGSVTGGYVLERKLGWCLVKRNGILFVHHKAESG